MSTIVDVAAAVIQKPDGEFLLAERPAGKPYAGWWEFPGGKVEPGESPRQALVRELHEELGIEVDQSSPWITRIFHYSHATVRLHFFYVTGWHGEPHGKENQRLSWQYPNAVTVHPLLPANGPILNALRLPRVYAISQAGELGEARFLERLETGLLTGIRLIQVREKNMPASALKALTSAIVERAHGYGAQVLVNGDIKLADETGADGVQLNSNQLMSLEKRPGFELVGASCHDRAELERAAELGLDFAVLSPVQPTLSHPGAPALGWEKFTQLLIGLPMPVYALGGVAAEDMSRARQCGAHGVAMLRAAWK